MRRRIAAVTGATLLAGTLSATTAYAAETSFTDQELSWATCPAEFFPAATQELALSAGLECAAVTAPRDWNSPDDGEEITVMISRLPHTGDRPERSILSNPGGPGGAGLYMPAALGALPELSASEFIGIDVRGTGASTRLDCTDEFISGVSGLPSPRDRSAQTLAQVEDVMRSAGKSCAQDEFTPFVTTEQTVQDFDLIRELLGRDTVDYYGVSGGTWLGAQYATYFPEHVGRFVLDSALDVTATMQDAFGMQPMGIQRRFETDFAGYAAQYSWLFHLGSTPEEVVATYDQLHENLNARPVTVPGVGAVNGWLLDSVIVNSVYQSSQFETVAWTMLYLRAAHAAAVVGDTLGLQDFAALAGEQMLPALDAFQASQNSTFLAIKCNDTPWDQGSEFWNAQGEALGPQYPLFGWHATWEPCGYWDRPDVDLPVPDGEGLPPVLVTQSLTDGPTAYEGGLATAKALPGAFVTVEGGDHALYGTNECVTALTSTFLTTGELPAEGTVCPATPTPAPLGLG